MRGMRGEALRCYTGIRPALGIGILARRKITIDVSILKCNLRLMESRY